LHGAFDNERLVGVAILDSRFIGNPEDQLQLKFLHVSRSFRQQGLGSKRDLPIEASQKQELLELLNPAKRLEKLLGHLSGPSGP
jgi:hypothetical protein